MMKRLLRIISRAILILPSVVLQTLWYTLIFYWLKKWIVPLLAISMVYQAAAIIYIIDKREEANYKIIWITILLLFPIIGTWIYIIGGNHRTSKPITRKILKNIKNPIEFQSESFINDTSNHQTMNMLHKHTKLPISKVDSLKYYPSGEKMYIDMLEDLKKANKFIFIEYFIIEKGKFLNSITDILKDKVNQGVDVKILYDDIGSVTTYSLHSKKELRENGIDIVSFNPVKFIHFTLNNRDHRKMMIIDNEIVYSGGINIADEYINQKEKFGYWKDIGFRMTGEGVRTYTHMFTLFFNAYSKGKKIDEKQLSVPNYKESKSNVISYYDSPSNEEATSNRLFINLLGSSMKYAYFYTPYLILNDSLKEAFIQTSQRGVDVRLIIPGIPDKKIAYALSTKYAEELSKYGIKVYKYSPGFVHAKATIVDDRLCTIGSVNLDYRSLYLHYENNSVFDDKNLINNLKEDFLETQTQCREIQWKKKNIFIRIFLAILDSISPLL